MSCVFTVISALTVIIVTGVTSPLQINLAEALLLLLVLPTLSIVSSYSLSKFEAKKDKVDQDESVVIRLAPETDDTARFHIDRLKHHRYAAIEFYRVLIAEKKGLAVTTYDEKRQRSDMRAILRRNFGTDNIEKISFKELSALLSHGSLIPWFKKRLHLSQTFFMPKLSTVDIYKKRKPKADTDNSVILHK